MATLKESAAARKAAKTAKTVTDKLVGSNKEINSPTTSSTITHKTEAKERLAVGLSSLSTENITQMAPEINIQEYAVSDPHNPPETMPQVSSEQRERADAIYTGGINSAYLKGRSLDLTTEVAKTVGKQFTAVGAIYQALNKKEKAQGDAYDYYAQVETTNQKGVALDVAAHKTVIDTEVAGHTKAQLDQKLEQAQIATQYAVAETQGKRDKLEAFQKTLGIIAAKGQKV